MKRTIVQPADLSQEALANIKQWLGITQPAEDSLLEQLLHSAMELCESLIRQLPLECICEEALTPSGDWQCLDSYPVRAVTLVSSIANDGSQSPISVSDYELELNANGLAKLRFLRQPASDRIVVRFVAGIAPEWPFLPDSLRQGILRAAAYLYHERDSANLNPPPASITALWLPWRRVRLNHAC